MIKKKPLLFVLFLALCVFAGTTAFAAQTPQVPLAGSAIPQFVDPLPGLETIAAGAGQIELQMKEFQSSVLPTGFVPPGIPLGGQFNGTWVWGYLQPGAISRASYIGPVIVTTRGQPTEIKFVNNLGTVAATNVPAWKYSTDQTLMWADPLNNESNQCAMKAVFPPFGDPCADNYNGPIPGVVHLHGGEVPPELDGGPDAWFISDGTHVGHGYYSKDGLTAKNYAIYRYPNTQEAAPIWFHDHVLGATRLNVYAGMAGAYLITDPQNDPTNLPPLVPLVIQDRMFDTNGQLFFPADTAGAVLWSPNPEHPYWVPEFVGDTIVVNGKTWPFVNVEPKRYTFLLLNGSNARTYELFLPNPVTGVNLPFWVIATDGGYLDKPVAVNKLVIMPGERYEVVIDFASAAPVPPATATSLVLKNTGRTPFPKGAPPNGTTVGKIVQFRVGTLAAADTSWDPAAPGATLRGGAGQGPALVRLVNPATGTPAAGVTAQKTRLLTLNEVLAPPVTVPDPVTGALTAYPGGPLEILVNNTKYDGK